MMKTGTPPTPQQPPTTTDPTTRHKQGVNHPDLGNWHPTPPENHPYEKNKDNSRGVNLHRVGNDKNPTGQEKIEGFIRHLFPGYDSSGRSEDSKNSADGTMSHAADVEIKTRDQSANRKDSLSTSSESHPDSFEPLLLLVGLAGVLTGLRRKTVFVDAYSRMQINSSHPPYPPKPHKNDYGTRHSKKDKAEAAASTSAGKGTQAYFSAHAYRMAKSLLDHYLDNTGKTYVLSEEEIKQICADPVVSHTIAKRQKVHMNKAIKNVENGKKRAGTVQHISDRTWTVTGSQDPAVVYSVGHFSIAVESDIVVTQRPDGGYHAQIKKTTVHVYDYYDYHQDEDGFSRSTVSNRLHFLHLAGWAREFAVVGTVTYPGKINPRPYH